MALWPDMVAGMLADPAKLGVMMCKLAFCLSYAAESGGKWTAGGEGERCLVLVTDRAVWPLRRLKYF